MAWSARWLREHALVAAIVAVSAFLHLWRLGERPLNHDEAIDAWFSWRAGAGEVIRYDPVYHGPLRFWIEGAMLHLFGIGASIARLPAALAGIVATAVIAGSRRILGPIGAPAAAVLFTVSPTVLTVSRTGREDSLIALISVALLLVGARLIVDPRPLDVVTIGALLACSFAIKETTFLFGAVAFVFLLGAAALASRSTTCRAAFARLGTLPRRVWLWTVTTFLFVFAFAFTSAFRDADGLRAGLIDGVDYWWSQQPVGRGGQPWFFYLAVYGAYEWLIIGLAAASAVLAWRRRSLVGAWFVTMAVGQLVVYSWAGEKFAWLAIHPLLPAVLAAGLAVDAVAAALADADRRRRAAALALRLGVALSLALAIPPAITDGANPAELLVAVQTSDDVPPIVDDLRRRADDGSIERIWVDDSGGGAWPWVWYLHGLDVDYDTFDQQALPEGYDAYIVLANELPPDAPAGFRLERFRLRVWWAPNYGAASVGDVTRWFVTRRTWSPTGSSDQWLIIREPTAG